MKGKTGGLIILILGLLLIVVGVAIKFMIFPGQAQWPDNVDSTRTYDGTLHVMLNSQALETMDLANLFIRDKTITIKRHVTTEEIKGDKAVVREYAELLDSDGNVLQPSDDWYAIDRKTMNHIEKSETSGFDNSDKIKARAGLVIGFPIGTEKKAYDGWNDDFQIVLQATFEEEQKREQSGLDLDTFYFESKSSAGEIKNEKLLAVFPKGLPKNLLTGLIQTIGLPVPEQFEELKEPLMGILLNLPDPVPLKYTYEHKTRYWIEPTTGMLIDYNKRETRNVALSKDLMAQAAQSLELPKDTRTKLIQFMSFLPDPVPLVAVFDLEFEMSNDSIKDATQEAKDAKGQMDLFGTTIPLGALVVGLALILVGLVLMRAKEREETAQDV